MLKVYEVESRKGKLTTVVATNKKEVEKYADNNKDEFRLDMSGYFKINYLKDKKVTVNYDKYENAEIIIDSVWDTSAHLA